jgi:hypothetical protein
MTKFVSPKGVAGYPKLTRPDTKFNAEGVYTTNLTIDKADAENFISAIEDAYTEEFGAKALPKANWPFKEEDGKVIFKFKTKNRPILIDSKGNTIAPKVAEELRIGSGSVLKVQGAISCRSVSGKNYATLYMNKVMLVELVEYNSGGFEPEEGGFVAPTASTESEDEGDTSSDDNGPVEF